MLLVRWSGGQVEIVARDRGWHRIREDDRGLLWERPVLDSPRFRYPDENLFHWRDKAGREVDFVVRRAGGGLDSFECMVDPDEIEPRSTAAFRQRYPRGRDFIVVPSARRACGIRRGGREFAVCGAGAPASRGSDLSPVAEIAQRS